MRAEGKSRGRAREGAFPPLVRGVRGISPEKILYFRTSVETIFMHFEEAMYWSKTIRPNISYPQDSPCLRNGQGIRKTSVD